MQWSGLEQQALSSSLLQPRRPPLARTDGRWYAPLALAVALLHDFR
jgi:hypothetical protein